MTKTKEFTWETDGFFGLTGDWQICPGHVQTPKQVLALATLNSGIPQI